jgi:hypothetical protein
LASGCDILPLIVMVKAMSHEYVEVTIVSMSVSLPPTPTTLRPQLPRLPRRSFGVAARLETASRWHFARECGEQMGLASGGSLRG